MGLSSSGRRGLWHSLATDLHPSPSLDRLDAEAEIGSRATESRARNAQDEGLELERGESQGTEGTRHAAEAETDVRLTGLIPRLTSPSRNHVELVDIWFGIERRQRTYEWDEAFVRVAEGWRPDPRHQSHFALFSHPSSNALIVARQVSSDRNVWREIEAEARALVNRVNRAVAEQRTPPAPMHRSSGSLLGRRNDVRELSPRSWLSEAAQAIRSLVPKPNIPVSDGSSTGAR